MIAPPPQGEVAVAPATDGGGPSTPSVSFADSSPKGGAARKLTYKDQRDFDRLPGEIERLEAAVAADGAALSDPDLYIRNPTRFAELTERIARHRADIEAAEVRWLEVAELAESLASGSALRTSARG